MELRTICVHIAVVPPSTEIVDPVAKGIETATNTIVSAISAITALDFLGFGLPPPTPSLGELLKQGTQTLTTAPWIVSSAFAALVFILTLVTFIGEAVREAFDPKKFTTYE